MRSDIEESVIEVLTSKFGQPIAELILEKYKEEILTKEAKKTECSHAAWRFVEGDECTRCDSCGKTNV